MKHRQNLRESPRELDHDFDYQPFWCRIKELDKQRDEFDRSQPAPKELYHYTTASGLQGILESNTLWATNAYYVNDSSEVEYGGTVLSEVLKEWEKKTEKTYDRLWALGAVHGLIEDYPERRGQRRKRIYVTCFCEDGNLLSQWRTYGQAGGYAIAFPLDALRTGLQPPDTFFASRLRRVEYSRQRQKERLLTVLADFYSTV